ncbi:alpha/beta hydrolase [Enterocloster hominis (ex Hitch et al. 2024)]|uniref:Alpha/beta hydrolase family protein n=1 Tax=Enterocloster hominis (ex Hitch et al. 2024) TaxID=1917870 RepID=A0ABV1CZF4_9FIRM
MALLHCNFFSETLLKGENLYVIIPTPDSDELLNNKKVSYFKAGAKYQTLYLLHGGYGDYADWVRFTSIEKYAQEHKIAVVMASAGNSFYQDLKSGRYFTYISEEVPKIARALFPLSEKREDNFVAGLSMGGYGAYKLAFSHPERYACAASLSGALDIFGTMDMQMNGEGNPIMDAIKDDLKDIAGTDSDLMSTLKKLKARGAELPKLYQACGTEDFIYGLNCHIRDEIRSMGVDLTYDEEPGAHTWDYWDRNIQKVLDWLPLKRNLV